MSTPAKLGHAEMPSTSDEPAPSQSKVVSQGDQKHNLLYPMKRTIHHIK